MVRSELRSGIDQILKFITYLMIPAGLLIIYNQLFASEESLRRSLTGMVAALVPMVPEGLVLMTSVAFAVGVIRLGRRQCLVQELPAIEGLARVDVVCADKTGTLTENGMRLAEVRPAENADETAARQALAALAAADPGHNASWRRSGTACPRRPIRASRPPWRRSRRPRSGAGSPSATRATGCSALPTCYSTAAGDGGAGGGDRQHGFGVLLLGRSDRPVDRPDAPGTVTPHALVVLEQRVRPDARDTLDYFASQGVAVKVISGDNAVSVGAVAGSLGLPGGDSPVDARSLPDERDALAETLEQSTTFGRVRPDQKRAMVGALQSRGHTVAMTGDGVNDVLALKDADIGVSMGTGSPATRAVAQIVLLDNRFATLPHVVGEGRRVIGNIERVSNLFLTKTVYSVLLALLVGSPACCPRSPTSTPFPTRSCPAT